MSDTPPASAPTPGRDQRATYRRPPRRGTRVEVRRGIMGIGFDVAVELVDLSADGACVRLSATVLPGDPIQIALLRPGAARPHRLEAQVRWTLVEGGGMVRAGARFRHRLLPAELAALAEVRPE